jgi:catechol 2,3-dioxygenase-like lactoylglutathione lyase family enzyme
MAKLRHIAFAAKDVEATAKFYREAFDFNELSRIDHPLGYAISLSDGTINLTIVKFKGMDQLGKGLDYVGIHHIGFLVDDVDAASKKLEALGAKCFVPRPSDKEVPDGFEVKHRGPDGVVIDLCEHPWIGAAPLEKTG